VREEKRREEKNTQTRGRMVISHIKRGEERSQQRRQ
jgi:hypothetical protein